MSVGNERTPKDIEQIIKRRDEAFAELHALPFEERDYSTYRKLFMQVKYHTDATSKEHQKEKALARIRNILADDEKRKEYNMKMKMYYRTKSQKDRNIARRIAQEV